VAEICIMGSLHRRADQIADLPAGVGGVVDVVSVQNRFALLARRTHEEWTPLRSPRRFQEALGGWIGRLLDNNAVEGMHGRRALCDAGQDTILWNNTFSARGRLSETL